jgi:hypothetical protein
MLLRSEHAAYADMQSPTARYGVNVYNVNYLRTTSSLFANLDRNEHPLS